MSNKSCGILNDYIILLYMLFHGHNTDYLPVNAVKVETSK